jgi:hypothetical protein
MKTQLINLFNTQYPLRKLLRRLISRLKFGSYSFRLSIGAVDRPNYAYMVYQAAMLGKTLGHKSISVIEYGVAGGKGLRILEEHAKKIESIVGVKIEVYGFDTGKGLPQPVDYRDLMYHWKEGFFSMDVSLLQSKLDRSKLIIGDVRNTATNFFIENNPAPIGAIIHDFDYYSSTKEALQMLKAGDQYYLPRVYCYFDDVIGGETELYNDYTGQRLAINEFNQENDNIKLGIPYYLRSNSTEKWHDQIWIAHFFKNNDYNKFVSYSNQELPL